MKLKILLSIVTISVLLSSCGQKTENEPQNNTPQKAADSMSYAWGYNVARNLVQPLIDDSIAVNYDMLALGIKHYMDNDSSKTLFANATMDSLVQAIQMLAQAKQEQKMLARQQSYEKRLKTAAEDAKKFFAENKSKPNVKSEKPDIQYRIITEGKGAKPKAEDVIKFHLVAKFPDGEEIQSTLKMQPIEIPLSYGSPAMIELFKQMPTGSKWEIFWPAKLAYGEEGIKNVVPGESAIIWEVELLEIVANPQPPVAQ